MSSWAVLVKASLEAPEEIIRPCMWPEAVRIAAKEAREHGFKRQSGKAWCAPSDKPWGYVAIVPE